MHRFNIHDEKGFTHMMYGTTFEIVDDCLYVKKFDENYNEELTFAVFKNWNYFIIERDYECDECFDDEEEA